MALQAYQVLERRYRQTVPDIAPASEQRTSAVSLLRQFRVYGCIVASEKVARVIHPPARRATNARLTVPMCGPPCRGTNKRVQDMAVPMRPYGLPQHIGDFLTRTRLPHTVAQ
jgi:hypothetical protein